MQLRLEQGHPCQMPWRRSLDGERPDRTGSLVVLEGPDGAGKTTLAREAVKRLRSEGVDARYFAAPGVDSGSIGQLIHRLSHRPGDLGVTDDIDPLAFQLLHVAAHIDAIPRMLADLAEGQTVVLDRCWWSTWAYGKATGVDTDLLESALAIEASCWRGVLPTRVFLVEREENECFQPPGLVDEYRRLAAREQSNYPVSALRNDRRIDDASSDLLLELAAESVPPSRRPTRQRGAAELRAAPDPEPAHGGSPLQSTAAVSRPRAPLREAASTPIYDVYWRFAAQRQAIYFKRLRREAPPWTTDEVLLKYRFTNAYRATDRVSQYLIRNVIYDEEWSPEDTIFRILLFKLFNRIETWKRLRRAFGDVRYSDFSVERFSRVLGEGERVYSAAYIMPPPRGYGHARKYENHLALLNHMMSDGVTGRIGRARSLGEVYGVLASYSGIGPFLAYQYAIDLNYSELIDFSESDFVVAGPGAKSGIRRCFGPTPAREHGDMIAAVCERQSLEFESRGLEFTQLWGRPLQWIDCQNLFCEVDKYARVAHPEGVGAGKRVRIKQKYAPGEPLERPWFPPKWGINDTVERWCASVDHR